MTLGNPPYSKCPSCKSENTLRNSHTQSISEKIIRTITWYELFRCSKCGWRGWKSNYLLSVRTVKKIFFYLLLMILASVIVFNILKMVI